MTNNVISNWKDQIKGFFELNLSRLNKVHLG